MGTRAGGKSRKPLCLVIVGALCLAAAGAGAQEKAAGAPIRVFNAGELTLDRYTVVKRLWVDTWRSAFRVPTHGDSGAAIAALSEEATRAGADGIVNLHCLDDKRAWLSRGSSYFCYGLAIRLK